MKNSTKVLFFFHMHQPLYRVIKRAETVYILPWVFMHSVREYYDVARVIEESGIKLTINFVPSLLSQIEDYEKGKVTDIFLEHIKKRAEDLEEKERVFILKNFFSAHPENQIGIFPRYKELQKRRGTPFNVELELNRFTHQDLRDLQVLFLLSYMSVLKIEEEPLLKELVEKGKGFTEDEKNFLLEQSLKLVEEVIPLYKKLKEMGKIEISVSPYHHPLLPLLLDTDVAKEVHPYMTLPSPPYKDEENVRIQIDEGIKFYKEKFGENPMGIWPPEGALSMEVLCIFKEYGFRWTLTDEALLERSLGIPLRNGNIASQDLYRAYEIQGMNVLFRDRFISDRISFVYGRWSEDKAVEDFLSYLRKVSDCGEVLVVAFDGENPWVNYRKGGVLFLRKLFTKMARCEYAVPLTISSFLEETSSKKIIDKLSPGSWVAGSFTPWIGHPEKNRAWEYLGRVKRDLSNELTKNHSASRSFLAAQGSDWFWWFGEDHPSLYAEEFDILFRTHLKNCYKKLGKESPPFLDTPIKRLRRAEFKRPLVGKIKPEIDGRMSHYFEWLPAAEIDLTQSQAETMERGKLLSSLYFGVDSQNLYLRVDGKQKMREILSDEFSFSIHFHFYVSPSTEWHLYIFRKGEDWDYRFSSADGIVFAVDQILEVSIPLNIFGDRDEIELSISIEEKGLIIERYPFSGFFVLSPLKFDEGLYWSV